MESSSTLFVNNTINLTRSDLITYCSKYGLIKSCTMTDSYSFVVFESKEDACRFLDDSPHQVNNSSLAVAVSRRTVEDDEIVRKRLFVSGLDSSITKSDLHNYFSKYGQINKVSMVDEKSAFIHYENDQSVQQIILIPNYHRLNGIYVNVNRAAGTQLQFKIAPALSEDSSLNSVISTVIQQTEPTSDAVCVETPIDLWSQEKSNELQFQDKLLRLEYYYRDLLRSYTLAYAEIERLTELNNNLMKQVNTSSLNENDKYAKYIWMTNEYQKLEGEVNFIKEENRTMKEKLVALQKQFSVE
ncbi:unnamed protein product, partial [Didymodactylos carnosus]